MGKKIYGKKTRSISNVLYKQRNQRAINKRKRILQSNGEKFLLWWEKEHHAGRKDYGGI